MLSCLFLTCFMLINEVIDGVTHQLRIFYLEAIFSFFNCIVSSAGRWLERCLLIYTLTYIFPTLFWLCICISFMAHAIIDQTTRPCGLVWHGDICTEYYVGKTPETLFFRKRGVELRHAAVWAAGIKTEPKNACMYGVDNDEWHKLPWEGSDPVFWGIRLSLELPFRDWTCWLMRNFYAYTSITKHPALESERTER